MNLILKKSCRQLNELNYVVFAKQAQFCFLCITTSSLTVSVCRRLHSVM